MRDQIYEASHGAVVTLLVKRRGGKRWLSAATTGVNESGAWKARYRPTRRGTYRFYAIYDSTATKAISVVVR